MPDETTVKRPSLDELIAEAKRRTLPPKPRPASDSEQERELER